MCPSDNGTWLLNLFCDDLFYQNVKGYHALNVWVNTKDTMETNVRVNNVPNT